MGTTGTEWLKSGKYGEMRDQGNPTQMKYA